jgi:hypothetical protein
MKFTPDKTTANPNWTSPQGYRICQSWSRADQTEFMATFSRDVLLVTKAPRTPQCKTKDVEPAEVRSAQEAAWIACRDACAAHCAK